jgi:hypothetical protein
VRVQSGVVCCGECCVLCVVVLMMLRAMWAVEMQSNAEELYFFSGSLKNEPCKVGL